MPSLTLPPCRPSSHSPSPDTTTTNQIYATLDQIPLGARPPSPVAPQYSPITPKLQPNLPVKTTQPPFLPPENGKDFTFATGDMPPKRPRLAEDVGQPDPPIAPPPPPAAAQRIPQPPRLPFSSDDATDAIALRAAISTLLFQRKKAQEDIKKLEDIKNLALDDPDHFKTELAAGRLKEQRMVIGDLQAILDAGSGSDDDDEVVWEVAGTDQHANVPPSTDAMDVDKRKEFPRIPGAQDVVRMPHINWDKYGIVGEALDRMHEQQRRWPGAAPGKRREFTVAAPYSPFLDVLDTPQHQGSSAPVRGPRKDSAMTPTLTNTVSEHPMETRRRG